MVGASARQLACTHLSPVPHLSRPPRPQAYLSQMVFLLAPVLVALIAKALFK